MFHLAGQVNKSILHTISDDFHTSSPGMDLRTPDIKVQFILLVWRQPFRAWAPRWGPQEKVISGKTDIVITWTQLSMDVSLQWPWTSVAKLVTQVFTNHINSIIKSCNKSVCLWLCLNGMNWFWTTASVIREFHFIFLCSLCFLCVLNNLVDAATYSIRLCTCESVLGHGIKLLMWELTRREMWRGSNRARPRYETTVRNCA